MNHWVRFAIGMMSAAATAATVSSNARAEVLSCCGGVVRWASDVITMRWSQTSFPVGSPFIPRMQDCGARWTELAESTITVNVFGDTDNFVSFTNFVNEMWYTAGSHPSNFGQFAFKRYSNNDCTAGCSVTAQIIEVDIVTYGTVNGSGITWLTSVPTGSANPPFPGSGSSFYFLPSMLHEFGHAIGLEHEPQGLARMSPKYPNGGWFYNAVGVVSPVVTFGKDRADANQLYPANASYSDRYMAYVQSATHPDGTTNVSRPLSQNPTTGAANFYPRNPATGSNDVPINQSVEARYCRGNLGTQSAAATTINRYLSTDRFWDASDIVVAGLSDSLLSGRATRCTTASFTVPAGTPTGVNYYILYGTGTSGDNIAAQDRTFRVVP